MIPPEPRTVLTRLPKNIVRLIVVKPSPRYACSNNHMLLPSYELAQEPKLHPCCRSFGSKLPMKVLHTSKVLPLASKPTPHTTLKGSQVNTIFAVSLRQNGIRKPGGESTNKVGTNLCFSQPDRGVHRQELARLIEPRQSRGENDDSTCRNSDGSTLPRWEPLAGSYLQAKLCAEGILVNDGGSEFE